MFEFENKVIQKIALKTKIQYETLSECFGLHQRDLLFSDDYSKIIIPIYNNISISGVIEDITFLHYLKHKYINSNIYIVTKNNDQFNRIFDLFSHLFAEHLKCKRYLELLQISKDIKATKFIYNKSLDLLNDLDTNCINGINLNNNTIIEKYLFNNEFPETYKYCLSTKNKNLMFLKRIQFIGDLTPDKLNEIFIINTNNDLYKNLYVISQCKIYVNVQNNSVFDYLVPYMNKTILFHNTEIYDNLVNKYLNFAISAKNKKIKPLIMNKLEV